eukprot:3010768-Amphidinium_carterae.2
MATLQTTTSEGASSLSTPSAGRVYTWQRAALRKRTAAKLQWQNHVRACEARSATCIVGAAGSHMPGGPPPIQLQ